VQVFPASGSPGISIPSREFPLWSASLFDFDIIAHPIQVAPFIFYLENVDPLVPFAM
jgi:hypothetical protein